jgi:hypothetical protein
VKIFLSYSRDDAGDFAEHIYKVLKNREYDVFIDLNNIKIGDTWANSIEKNISDCDFFVVILTIDSLMSSNVENEVLQAQKNNRIIVPCIHKDVEDKDIKWGLEKKQGIKFSDKFDLARTLPSKIIMSLSTSIEKELENISTIREQGTKNTKSILKELENISTIRKQGTKNTKSILKELENISTIREQGTKNTKSILKELENISTIREQGTKNTKSILKELENIQKNTMDNFDKIRTDLVKFDLSIPADRLLFYLRLLEYFTYANEAYLYQNRIKLMLANSLRKKKYPISNIGYDEIFYNAHSIMNDKEKEMFNFLRRTTEDFKLINIFARRLLQDNLEISKEMPELKLLYEHYCYWLAKYELLKNDPDMCLLYVGPKQKKGFPIGIESRINEKIKALRKETLMQDLP